MDQNGQARAAIRPGKNWEIVGGAGVAAGLVFTMLHLAAGPAICAVGFVIFLIGRFK